MARRPSKLNYAHLDVFEAVKRAYIRRGFVPKRHRIKDLEVASTPAAAAKSQSEDDEEQEIESHNGSPASKAEAESAEDANHDDVEPEVSSEKLVNLTTNAHEVLMEATTVFPFKLFPDTITVDREKLTIANRSFFQTAAINSMPITDIQSVEATVGPFFGSLHIIRSTMSPVSASFHVKFLWRDDVVKMQRLLQGYIIAHQKKVDCSTIDKVELIALLNDLGQGVPD